MKNRNAFTLIELLVVMGLMAVLMGISTMGFIGMRRGAELRGGAMVVRTTLMLARQQAVTKRQTVRVDIASTNMTVSFSAGGQTNRTINFSPGITVTSSKTPLLFQPSGGIAGGTGTAEIEIEELPSVGNGSKTIKVWLLTGASKEESA
jgi:prepilin-type N-terminal cleavage/methylation domain-containing protein